MKSIGKYYEDKINKKCPKCGDILSIVLHGLVREDFLKELREKGVPFYNHGCCCFGDDRDSVYWCPTCKIKLDNSMKEIILKKCPRVCDYYIRQEECENEKLLRKKFITKERIYCDACRLMKNNDEAEYRKAAHLIGLSEDVIEMVIQKKHRNLRLKNNMQFIDYLCEESKVLERIELWND